MTLGKSPPLSFNFLICKMGMIIPNTVVFGLGVNGMIEHSAAITDRPTNEAKTKPTKPWEFTPGLFQQALGE